MSNSSRPIIPKKFLLKQLRDTQESLTKANAREIDATRNLASLEVSYINAKDKVKSITDKSLFSALYAAFRLWKGERLG